MAEIKKNREEECAENVAMALNVFGFDNEAFCKQMCKEHRTLQQSFTRLCIHWLSTCASDDYRYDGRNEASHEVAKALIESQDPDFIGYLPFI